MKVKEEVTKWEVTLLVLLHLEGKFRETFASNQSKEYETLERWLEVQDLKNLVEKQFKVTKVEVKAIQKLEACRQHGRLVQDFIQKFGLLMG